MECKISPNLFAEIADVDGFLVTVNQRLASLRHRQYDQWRQQQGRNSWLRPNILPINRWILSLWQDYCQGDQYLLDDFAAQQIWQKIIQQQHPELLQIPKTATLAFQAWNHLQLWQLSLGDLRPAFNQQVAQFAQWAEAFQSQCHANNWCGQSQMANQLVQFLDLESITLPKAIYLDGFDDLAPAVQALFGKIAKVSNIYQYQSDKPSVTPAKIMLADNEQEIWQMALWAKAQHAQNPEDKIGCIIPNLNQIRNQVDSIFSKVFVEENTLPGMEHPQSTFNLSAGQNLHEFAICRVAMQLLSLLNNPCDMSHLGQLLQSPYLCHSDNDKSLGAKIDAELLETGVDRLPLPELFNALNQHVEQYPKSTWLDRWRNFYSLSKDCHDRTPSQWAEHFKHCLLAIGWPGQRRLSSLEYQLIKKMLDVFSELAALDTIIGVIDCSHAFSLFSDLVDNTVFQPKSEFTAVQVLGILESTGFEFDACWIMGLTDETWPPAASPNPFLPFSLQLQHNMPHSCAERELLYTKNMMHRLLKSANTLIISAPLKDGDKTLQPSHFVADYPLMDFEPVATSSYANVLLQSNDCEIIDDNFAPLVTESETIRGGSWIIKQQALCPFRAFASVRLNTYSLAQPERGLSAADRGILLHECLDQIWGKLIDHQTLMQYTADQLGEYISPIITSVVESYKSRNNYSSDNVLAIEKIRLQHLLTTWLEQEKSRLPFSVLQTETRFSITVGQLNLRLQVDRIDQLDNGRYVIIDYKTGQSHISQWFSERPQDPQLPLYCAFTKVDNQYDYSGIAFAQIQAKQSQFKGVLDDSESDAKQYLPGIHALNQIDYQEPMNWEDTVNQWKKVIHELSDNFCHGDAQVDPVEEQTCLYCDLQNLCRRAM